MQNQRNLRETEAGARVLFRLGQCYLDAKQPDGSMGAAQVFLRRFLVSSLVEILGHDEELP